jgi:hypothetical protein
LSPFRLIALTLAADQFTHWICNSLASELQRGCLGPSSPRAMGRNSSSLLNSTQALLRRLFDDLDYQALAAVYCEAGGEAFWAAHRDPALELGQRWALACSKRLSRGGHSLYVGAGVAELAVLVTEVCDLERQVRVANTNARECESLNTTLAGVGLADRLCFQPVDAAQFVASDPAFVCDHLSVVSVLNDPGTYPNVSGVGYGRIAPVLLDVEEFALERDRIRKLVATTMGCLEVPGTITTTVEEVPWFLAAAADQGLAIQADEEVVPTAIVGDPLGFLRVTRSDSPT